MKKKVWVYESTEYDYIGAGLCDINEDPFIGDNHVMLSEVKIVEFKENDSTDVVNSKIDHIDKQIEETKAKFEVLISGLHQKKAELLALPNLNNDR